MTSTYEQKALELDKKLALLLGYTNIEVVRQALRVELWGKDKEGSLCSVPRWTQDNHSAFSLMVECNVDVNSHTDEGMITAYIEGSVQGYSADLCEFISKESAFRVVIVQAVINKLRS